MFGIEKEKLAKQFIFNWDNKLEIVVIYAGNWASFHMQIKASKHKYCRYMYIYTSELYNNALYIL